MVSHVEITKVKPEELRLNTLPPKVKRAFEMCTKFRFLSCKEWYLAGGTALALQAGHRQSVDLDFFSPRGAFGASSLERFLFNTKKWETAFGESGTLYGRLRGAKMSFIAYPFFKPSPARVQCGNICILTPADIAAMKILAISQRGRKRDFVDLYWYCSNREALEGIIQSAIFQYRGQEHNLPHILKSLVYFEDAENDPMPKLFFRADWRTIKAYFRREVPKVARKLLKLGK